MFEGMKLVDKVRDVAPGLFGDRHGNLRTDLVPRLEQALRIARGLDKIENPTDDDSAAMVARMVAILDKIDECLPELEAWCAVKHYSDNWAQPVVWCAFLSREQAEAFAPAIEEAYHRPWNRRDLFKVERRRATVDQFIAPTTTVAEYVAEIKRYGFGVSR